MLQQMGFTTSTLWRVLYGTLFGCLLSLTPLKDLENVGASKMANIALYFLVATIGMHMDITMIFKNPGIFVLGKYFKTHHKSNRIILYITLHITQIRIAYRVTYHITYPMT